MKEQACKAEEVEAEADAKHPSQHQSLKLNQNLRWMCGYTKLDRIRNTVIRDKVGVTPIEDKIREARLMWFGHVSRRSTDALVRRSERLILEDLWRCRDRPKKRWGEVTKQDMAQLQLTEDMTLDRKI
ncbi:uncharacterized protein [Nicotiana tomentosiformis]|uniref:uncharacterized protein n=1 Tax=Nicotiana tomentosiformis TaxID=4098 RepID=UPI00388C79F3